MLLVCVSIVVKASPVIVLSWRRKERKRLHLKWKEKNKVMTAWTGGGGWGHPQGAVHMVAARLGFEKAMVGTGRATPRLDCMDRERWVGSPAGCCAQGGC